MSGYQVSPAQLKQHATSFGTLAQQVHTASEAANTEGVLTGGNPYGIMFTPLIFPPLEAVCSATQGFLAGMAKVGDGIHNSLEDNVDIYTEAEKAIGNLIKKVMP